MVAACSEDELNRPGKCFGFRPSLTDAGLCLTRGLEGDQGIFRRTEYMDRLDQYLFNFVGVCICLFPLSFLEVFGGGGDEGRRQLGPGKTTFYFRNSLPGRPKLTRKLASAQFEYPIIQGGPIAHKMIERCQKQSRK